MNSEVSRNRVNGRPVAVVTGATRGIGRAVVERLATAGVDVAATDIEVDTASAKNMTSRGAGYVRALPMDVRDREAIERVAVTVRELYGGIDILVNNAGVFRQTPALSISEETMRSIVDINLCGALRCTAVFGAMMATDAGGRIVNVASVSGLGGAALASAYAASKAGLIAATRSAARELADRGISVNAIAPGYCETPMLAPQQHIVEKFVVPRIPKKRVAAAAEVADVVLYLATDAPEYQTGSVTVVDGGLTSG